MNVNSKSGSGSASAFFVALFLASVALNVAFVTGCISANDFQGDPKGSKPIRSTQQISGGSESSCLREIAASIGLSPSQDKTPGDIAFDIQQVLGNTQKYRGDVFSDEAFDKYRKAFLTNKDAETFEAYHIFIKRIEGKQIVILNNKE